MNKTLRNNCLAIMLLVLATACGHVPEKDMVRHEVKITVIYATPDEINAEARSRGYRAQVNGFYDSMRNEIWCPDEETPQAFRSCGHELRNAVVGSFHDDHAKPSSAKARETSACKAKSGGAPNSRSNCLASGYADEAIHRHGVVDHGTAFPTSNLSRRMP
jgi:hypothetical protein